MLMGRIFISLSNIMNDRKQPFNHDYRKSNQRIGFRDYFSYNHIVRKTIRITTNNIDNSDDDDR